MSQEPDEPVIGYPNSPVGHAPKHTPWVWEGVLAEDAITLLSAPEKIGKTTLLSLLLDRRRQGGALLGRTVYPGRTLVCSEESRHLWELRQPPLDFGPDLHFHRPVDDYPGRGRWRRYIDDVLDLFMREGAFNLFVVRLVAGCAAAVLILNQNRNVHRPLAAFADIVLEMAAPRAHAAGRAGTTVGPVATRRRTFTGVGRYPGTLESAVAELNPVGTDYVLVESSAAAAPPLLPILQELLAASPTPLTRQELLARWPSDPPRPDSLWRTLRRGLECGVFITSGTGTRTDPFRYALMDPPTSAPLPTEE
jgi:AAA domain